MFIEVLTHSGLSLSAGIGTPPNVSTGVVDKSYATKLTPLDLAHWLTIDVLPVPA